MPSSSSERERGSAFPSPSAQSVGPSRLPPRSKPLTHGAVELIGYGCRAYGNSNPDSKLAYILQALLILLAPILFAASVYMFLSRIIQATGQYSCSMIRPNWLTKIFVGGDVLCFLIQAVGAAILAGSDTKKSSDLGKAVILVGLFVQIAVFGLFMVVGIAFHRRARRLSGGKPVAAEFNWEGYLHQLYVVSVLISVRNVFRVIEYAMGGVYLALTRETTVLTRSRRRISFGDRVAHLCVRCAAHGHRTSHLLQVVRAREDDWSAV